MVHKCLRCNKMYSDSETFTVKQCIQCGGRFFLSAETEEELLRKEELQTPEEKALGVAGEVEVRRIGDVVVVKKISSKEDAEKEIKRDWKKEQVKKEKMEKEIKEKVEILEAPSPEPVKVEREIYGWKKYTARGETNLAGVSQIQTIGQRQIEENKLKIESIFERGGIEDIKPKDVKEEKKKIEATKIAEEKPKILPLTDEEWLEKVFKDKIEGVVSMDIETLKILRTGKYEIDVSGLMGDKPVIASIREGTYYIDLHSAIDKFQKKKTSRT